MSLSSCFDSVAVFRDATIFHPEDLRVASFKILQVSSRTPNFKVQFSDGTTSYLSFPDYLGQDPKGGLKMPQLTASDMGQLNGCMATAKLKSVLGSFGRRDQIWDLDCPQAHIHYGPEVAGSQIRMHPALDLFWNLLASSFWFFMTGGMIILARALGKSADQIEKEG